MMNGKATAICFFVLFMIMSPAAYCGEGISAGPLKIKPSVEIHYSSDSNVLLAPEDQEQDDTYYTVYPRVICDFPYQAHLFKLDYGIRFRRYSDLDSEDVDLQNLDFEGLVVVNSQLKFRIMDRYRELSGDTEEILGRVEYSRNRAEIKGMYELSSMFSVEATYAKLSYDYEDETLFGRSESHFGGAVIYNLYEKWGVLAEFTHGEVDIDDTENDASFNRFLVGMRGQFTPKLMGKVKAGWESRSYDGDREDTDLGYLLGELVHEVASDMKLQIGATQELHESITYEGSAYTVTQGRARLTKDFADRITLILSGYFQSNAYETGVLRGEELVERADDIWQAAIGVEYKLNKWTHILASMEHKSNDSNFDENDYKYNRFNLGARLEY